MRLFVAVEIPSEVLEALARLIEDLRRDAPGVRWSDPSRIHLTIKFLGEVDEAAASELSARLERAAASVAGGAGVLVRGVGTFGGRSPRVVWAGVEAPGLVPLRDAVEEAAAACGFPRESRPFKPHLTLARLKKPSPRLGAALARQAGREIGRFEARSCALIRSLLRPDGAEYLRLREFGMGEAA